MRPDSVSQMLISCVLGYFVGIFFPKELFWQWAQMFFLATIGALGAMTLKEPGVVILIIFFGVNKYAYICHLQKQQDEKGPAEEKQ